MANTDNSDVPTRVKPYAAQPTHGVVYNTLDWLGFDVEEPAKLTKALGIKVGVAKNIAPRADPKKSRTRQLALTNYKKLLDRGEVSKKRLAEIKKAIESDELIDLSEFNKQFSKLPSSNESTRNQDKARTTKDIEALMLKNIKNLSVIDTVKAKMIEGIMNVISANPKLIGALMVILQYALMVACIGEFVKEKQEDEADFDIYSYSFPTQLALLRSRSEEQGLTDLAISNLTLNRCGDMTSKIHSRLQSKKLTHFLPLP